MQRVRSARVRATLQLQLPVPPPPNERPVQAGLRRLDRLLDRPLPQSDHLAGMGERNSPIFVCAGEHRSLFDSENQKVALLEAGTRPGGRTARLITVRSSQTLVY
jgi:hypothetical protein